MDVDSQPTAVPGLGPAAPDAVRAVSALYAEHALGLIRLAVVMIGDRHGAEDIVQEAFCGLYRRWAALSDSSKALQYARAAVLNGCRSRLRRSRWQADAAIHVPPVVSAEAEVITTEEHRAVISALRKLPHRQREVLVLRFYPDLPEAEIAQTMGIGPSSVRSAASRALAALGRMLEEAR